MNKELVELRAVLVKRASVCSELARQLDSAYYSARADAFCSAIIELDQILIKCMKGCESK